MSPLNTRIILLIDEKCEHVISSSGPQQNNIQSVHPCHPRFNDKWLGKKLDLARKGRAFHSDEIFFDSE